jgi:MoxR-like ATPase
MTITTVVLTKASQRTTRQGLHRCPNGTASTEPLYRFTNAAGAEVMVKRTDYTAAAKEGDTITVRADDVHDCNGAVVAAPHTVVETVKEVTIDLPPAQPIAPQNVTADGPANVDGVSAEVREMLWRLLGRPTIDRAEVERIAREVVEGVVMPTRTIVVNGAQRVEIEGVAHRQMEEVLWAISAGLNVQMVGGPGVGKTHMAAQIAVALGRGFYCIGFHLQSTASELKGYMSATGEFIPTVVFDWASNPEGGLLLADELDRSHPGIQAALNSLLSNRFIVLPNREIIYLNDNHVILAATNTFGDGPDWQYPAAQRFSAEFKDRFVAIEIEIDENVEMAAAMAKGAPADLTQRAVSYVHRVRAAVQREAIEGVVVSPRASQNLAALLARHPDRWDAAVKMTLRKGIGAEAWAKIS